MIRQYKVGQSSLWERLTRALDVPGGADGIITPETVPVLQAMDLERADKLYLSRENSFSAYANQDAVAGQRSSIAFGCDTVAILARTRYVRITNRSGVQLEIVVGLAGASIANVPGIAIGAGYPTDWRGQRNPTGALVTGASACGIGAGANAIGPNLQGGLYGLIPALSAWDVPVEFILGAGRIPGTRLVATCLAVNAAIGMSVAWTEREVLQSELV